MFTSDYALVSPCFDAYDAFEEARSQPVETDEQRLPHETPEKVKQLRLRIATDHPEIDSPNRKRLARDALDDLERTVSDTPEHRAKSRIATGLASSATRRLVFDGSSDSEDRSVSPNSPEGECKLNCVNNH